MTSSIKLLTALGQMSNVFVGVFAVNIVPIVSLYGDEGKEMKKSRQSISLSILINQSVIQLCNTGNEEKYSDLDPCLLCFP